MFRKPHAKSTIASADEITGRRSAETVRLMAREEIQIRVVTALVETPAHQRLMRNEVERIEISVVA
jgi:hypothetical protein